MSAPPDKRARVEGEGDPPAEATAATDVPGYTLDPASGWYINDTDPNWKVRAAAAAATAAAHPGQFNGYVHYNSAENAFYQPDPGTGQLQRTQWPPADFL